MTPDEMIAAHDWDRLIIHYKIGAHREQKELIQQIKKMDKRQLQHSLLRILGVCNEAVHDEEGLITKIDNILLEPLLKNTHNVGEK